MCTKVLKPQWLAAPPLVAGLLLASCGEDSLGKKFVPEEKDAEPGAIDQLGPGSPIAVGDARAYLFFSSYTPKIDNSCGGSAGTGGGLTCEERTSVGYICLKVTQVQDHASPDYQDVGHTRIKAELQVWGSRTAQSEIVIKYYTQAQPAPDPGEQPTLVDETHANLWLKKLTFADSRANPYKTTASKMFETRRGPTPPDQDLANLFFFEVRDSFVDETWGGWNHEIPAGGAINFPSQLERYFTHDVFGSGFTVGDDFSSQYSGSQSAVSEVQYTARLTWREKAAARSVTNEPAPFNGRDLIHHLVLEFDKAGALHSAEERIFPDLEPSVRVSTIDPGECESQEPCAWSKIVIWGEFGEAPCSF